MNLIKKTLKILAFKIPRDVKSLEIYSKFYFVNFESIYDEVAFISIIYSITKNLYPFMPSVLKIGRLDFLEFEYEAFFQNKLLLCWLCWGRS